jgi:hypothetical protein
MMDLICKFIFVASSYRSLIGDMTYSIDLAADRRFKSSSLNRLPTLKQALQFQSITSIEYGGGGLRFMIPLLIVMHFSFEIVLNRVGWQMNGFVCCCSACN